MGQGSMQPHIGKADGTIRVHVYGLDEGMAMGSARSGGNEKGGGDWGGDA